jgi:hypothetical protein
MLKIMLATCQTTLDTLRAADNPLDRDFVAELEHIVARTEAEIAEFAELSGP